MIVPLYVSLALLLAPSLGYPQYRDEIPNGNKVPHPCKANYMWQGVGHENPLGGGVRNVFGLAFKEAGYKWTVALCNLDSDGDGMSNGEELGDPNCVWSAGQLQPRTTNISHPGICTPYGSPQCAGKDAFVSCELEGFEDCPAINNPTVETLDLRFKLTQIPPTHTNYYCMTFDLPSDQDYHFIASEPIINNTNVVHHMLLYGCSDDSPSIDPPAACGMSISTCQTIVGTWTVGMPGQCYGEDVGFRVGKTSVKRVILQVHYNNPQLISTYTDSSGLRLYYQPEKPETVDLVTLAAGQRILNIPPGQRRVEQTGSCPSDCTKMILLKNAYIIMVINHMHYLGTAMKVELVRGGQLTANISYDEYYSYDSPLTHVQDPPLELRQGDEIKVTCVYNSMSTNRYTYYGEETSDEMCYGFLFVYPADALRPGAVWCVSDGPVSLCDRYFTGKPVNNCDWKSFTNFTNPTTIQMIEDLEKNCNLDGFCRPECRPVVEKLNEHPCLSGDMAEFTKDLLVKLGNTGLEILGRLQSCPANLSSGDCSEKCSEICEVKAGDDDDDDDGGNDRAGKMAATSVILVTVLSVIFQLTE